MSLILEALKKSERQRRLGESPSIGSPVMVVRRRRSLMPVLIGLIAVGLGVLWWLARPAETVPVPEVARQAEAPAMDPGPTTSASRNAATFDGLPANTPPEQAQSSAASRLPRSKVPTDATSGLPAEVREKVRNGELVVANPNLLKPGQPATIKETETISAPASKATPPPAQPPTVSAAVATETTSTTSPTSPAPSAAVMETPAKRTPPTAPAPVPAANPIQMIWELPLAVRRDLPELTVTMHVFAIAPENRFVILNGDRISKAMTLPA